MKAIKRHSRQEDGPSIHQDLSVDDRDMQRMALSSELRRRFKLASVIGFACISGATWEWALVRSLQWWFGRFVVLLSTVWPNLTRAGVIWIFLAVIIGMFTVVLSMAEMASIAPSTAGQYIWVSEVGPPGAQRLLSYFVEGWFATIGWQGAAASNPLVLAQHVEALIAFQDPTFEIQGWMTSLLMIAFAAAATVVNIHGIRFLSSLEAVMLALHVVGFFAVLIPLWLVGERSSTQDVFYTFEDNAGWGSVGTACLVGLLGPIMTLIGGDSTVHLGEEIKNASRTLPLSMVFTSLMNYAVRFIMTITVMYVSSSFDQAIADATGESYVAVIYAATQSKTATTILTVIILVLFFCTAINTVTTSSRQLFAFARDGGLPFSDNEPRTGLPINALLTTFGVTFVLSWIICGSNIAFQNITSITIVGLLLSYGTTIATMLYRRWSDVALPAARWRYPRAIGYLVNVLALCFISIAFIFAYFPTAPNPSAESMSWTVVVTLAVVIRGSSTFEGPAVRMKKAEDDGSMVAMEDIVVHGKQ
ncbi:amino acid transporter [Aureobasidium pullulans]|nr:amino acid transporter [Aureobasidium pullulans]